MKPNSLRLSYSLLSSWLRKDYDGIVESFLHLRTRKTSGMERGVKFDKYVEGYVKEHGTLPPELGGKKLQKPHPKRILQIGYNDMFVLKGEIDILDASEIIEIKCSQSKDSGQYANDWQVDFYLFIADLYPSMDDVNKIKKGVIYRYDPIKKTYDRSIVYKSKRRMDRIKRLIDREGPKLYQFLSDQGVL